MDDFIYLEIDEEITSVIDRLRESKGKRVGIVVPRGAMVLQSIVNLKLIQREAEKIKKFVGIITVDKVGRSLATQVGLPVFDDPKQAESSQGEPQHENEHKAVSDVIEIDMSQSEDELPEGVNVNYYTGESHKGEKVEKPAEKVASKVERSAGAGFAAKPLGEAVKNKLPASVEPKRKRRFLGLKIGLSIAVVIIAIVGAWLYLTKATVQVTIPAESYEAKADIKVDATLMASKPEEGIIKGTLITAEKDISRDIDSTGTKKVGNKATGNITFYNDAGIAQSIEAQTGVTANDGKKFILTQSISIPKASLDASGKKVQGSVEGKIESEESGTEYNLPSSMTYVVSGNNYVTAGGETSGGTSEEKKIVDQEDISGAEDSLVASAPQQLKDELTKQAKGEYIAESAISYEAQNFSTDKNAGDEADSFTASAKIVAKVITFKELDLRQAVAKIAQKDVPQGKSLLASEDDTFTLEIKSSDIPKKEMSLSVKMASHVGNASNIDGIPAQIKGKSVKDARQLVAQLMNVNIDNVQITVKPNVGLVRMPFFTKNIKLKFEYKNTNENSGT